MKQLTARALGGLVLMLSTLGSATAFAQVTYVDLPAGKKVVLKAQVRPDENKFYVFTARSGQTLTVRLISTNRRIVFSVDVVHNIRGPEIVSETLVERKRSWSGVLPDEVGDQFGVGVSIPAGRASYSLEITLR